MSLVVRLPLDPGAVANGLPLFPEDELPCLVVTEDEDGEGDGGQPPAEVKRVHPQAHIQAGAVAEEGSQGSLEAEAEVQEVVLHALLEHGVHPGLANDEISPLDNHDSDKKC